MVKHGKKYEEVAARVDKSAAYQPKDAIGLVKQTAPLRAAQYFEQLFVSGGFPQQQPLQTGSHPVPCKPPGRSIFVH